MTIKRKDFQKTAAYVQEFLLKLNEDGECAELRDALNLALLHMQKYYRNLQHRLQDNKNSNPLSRSTLRGLSPMTPFRDAPDKFQSKWIDLDNARASINAENGLSLGNLPLIVQAAKAGDSNLVREIVMKDQSHLYDADAIGRSALMYAVNYQHHEIVRLMVNLGADVSQAAHDGSTALHRACHDALPDCLTILLHTNCDVQPQDVFGRAPIHWAVITESTKCLQVLMARGANVNIRDKDGLSPSMWACRMDNIEHFQLLSQVENQDIEEADGIERDNSGRTWMHWAVRRAEPLECLRTLLTEETAPIKDDDGKTVLLLAAELGSLPACKLILEIAGKDCIKDRDDEDRSALHLSVNGGHGEVVNFLLDNGADLDCQDKYKATPLDYARARQLHYCQLILSSHIRQRAREGRTPESTLTSLSRDTSGFFDTMSKPITPPHPPRLPPPTTPRKMKRPMRSHSLSRSESFENGVAFIQARSRSLDVQDYRELRDLTNMFPDTPTQSKENLNDVEPAPPTAREPERPRTSRGATRQRTPNSPPDAPSRKEARRDEPDHDITDKMMKTPRSDDEEHMSMGEMEVSDIDGDGDESDQNTVIHRPVQRPSPIIQPPLQKFTPHPPSQASAAQPLPLPHPPSGPPPHPINSVYKPKDIAQPYRPALMRSQDEDARQGRRPVPPPRQQVYQGRIPPQAKTQSPQGSLAQQAQNQRMLPPAQLSSSSLRQKSPPVGSRRDKSSSLEHHRSSSQASSQDLTSHELHDEVAGEKHPAQAPLTPPESKRRPPLPPQLVPLNQPRLAGSHMALPPTKKERKKKKKRKERDVPTDLPPPKAYTAPLLPGDVMQPNVKSANIYSRRAGELLRGSADMERSRQDEAFTIEDSTDKPIPMARAPLPSARRGTSPRSAQVVPQSAQKQRTSPRGRGSALPQEDLSPPPQVEGHRVDIRRSNNSYTPHLSQLPPPHSLTTISDHPDHQ